MHVVLSDTTRPYTKLLCQNGRISGMLYSIFVFVSYTKLAVRSIKSLPSGDRAKGAAVDTFRTATQAFTPTTSSIY